MISSDWTYPRGSGRGSSQSSITPLSPRHTVWLEFRFPRWHRNVIYAPPLVISSSCRLTVWTQVAFGRFLHSVRDCSGTLSRLLRDTTTLLERDNEHAWFILHIHRAFKEQNPTYPADTPISTKFVTPKRWILRVGFTHHQSQGDGQSGSVKDRRRYANYDSEIFQVLLA